jgi:hypothetical protein
MQFSFFDFYQIYGKMLKVDIRPKLTPNEHGFASGGEIELRQPGRPAANKRKYYLTVMLAPALGALVRQWRIAICRGG